MSTRHLHQPDWVLVTLIFFLIGFGLVMLSSAGAVVGYERFGQSDYFLKRQFFNFVAGLLLFVLMVKIDYHVWRRLAVPLLLGTVTLLVLVFMPGFGFEAGGARRWIAISGFLLQPSEIAKLTFLIYLAAWLERKGRGIREFAFGLRPFLILLGLMVFLVLLQPDLGTVSIIVVVSLVVYYVAGAPWKHIVSFLIGSALLLALFIQLAPYRAARLTVFLNPELDPQGIGYHINQALLAIGSGGIFGVGLGHSRQKFNFLPEVTGDSIFAIIAEELGFILVVGLLLLFLLLLSRGLKIARRAPDLFGRYLATGIAFGITAQALINMGALTGLLPLTGITLPLISYGGSSLLMTMAALGLLANISRQTKI